MPVPLLAERAQEAAFVLSEIDHPLAARLQYDRRIIRGPSGAGSKAYKRRQRCKEKKSHIPIDPPPRCLTRRNDDVNFRFPVISKLARKLGHGLEQIGDQANITHGASIIERGINLLRDRKSVGSGKSV